jgi:two-component system, LytTR family, sensor kinase
MAESSPERRFTRIDRLPPYVFNITAELKMAARRRGEDIIDFSMGNPDGATPPHIVEKLCTVAQRPDTHGYSTSRGIPLWEKGVVTGTLKIYYCHAHRITSTLQEMAIGLSQIISTQLEVSRAEQLREMANKAELRALQSKINPHFLFNALNAISSSIRLNPDTARQLIFNLSRYLRYNIELKDDEQIDIKRELYQIKDYIAIEQARFGDKLTVIYDIDDDVSCVIPSLLIQPLVENAIVHGIQPCKGKGVVTIGINECGNRVRISVRDTGNGIDPAVVARVEADEMPGNKIGLLNVHHRVKLLYGEGLHIRTLTPGTEIAFYVPNHSTPQALTESLLS